MGGGMRIGNETATGQTLACLYGSYPVDRVAQYARPELPGGEFGEIVPMSRWVSPVAYSWRIVRVLSARLSRMLRRSGDGSQKVSHNAIRTAKLSTRKRISLDLDAVVDLRRVRIRRRKLRELKAAAPDVLHAVVYNAFSVRLALELSERLSVPILPQFTDDWITTIFTNGELRGRARTAMLGHLEKLIERSPALLVIGDAMADEYSARYGRPCFVTAYGVEPQDYRIEPEHSDGKKRLLYIGGGYIGRAEQIDRVAEWVRDGGWEVVVHTGTHNAWTPRSANVRMADELPLAELPRALVDADAVLFVESLRPEIVEYTRYSVSTKVSQLIAARRPILAIGPLGQGSIEELRANAPDAHFIHTDADEEGVEAVRFLSGEARRSDAPIPPKYHASVMRRNFEDAIRYAAEATGSAERSLLFADRRSEGRSGG
ncbi:glycosyltransferase family protein [Microbacterium xylanilyticum]